MDSIEIIDTNAVQSHRYNYFRFIFINLNVGLYFLFIEILKHTYFYIPSLYFPLLISFMILIVSLSNP